MACVVQAALVISAIREIILSNNGCYDGSQVNLLCPRCLSRRCYFVLLISKLSRNFSPSGQIQFYNRLYCKAISTTSYALILVRINVPDDILFYVEVYALILMEIFADLVIDTPCLHHLLISKGDSTISNPTKLTYITIFPTSRQFIAIFVLIIYFRTLGNVITSYPSNSVGQH